MCDAVSFFSNDRNQVLCPVLAGRTFHHRDTLFLPLLTLLVSKESRACQVFFYLTCSAGPGDLRAMGEFSFDCLGIDLNSQDTVGSSLPMRSVRTRVNQPALALFS